MGHTEESTKVKRCVESAALGLRLENFKEWKWRLVWVLLVELLQVCSQMRLVKNGRNEQELVAAIVMEKEKEKEREEGRRSTVMATVMIGAKDGGGAGEETGGGRRLLLGRLCLFGDRNHPWLLPAGGFTLIGQPGRWAHVEIGHTGISQGVCRARAGREQANSH